jgi:poly-D-alanine transfer protein DltD
MASNGKPQFAKNIFLQQSKGGLAEAVDASVRQDKARIASARTGTAQPAQLTKYTREQPVNSTLPRSQNRPTPNKRTKKLTLWVEPIVKEELERIANREGLSLSKSGAAFLKRSLQQHIDLEYSALLTPIIETAIEKRMRSRDSRLAWLLVRVAFDTGQTRSLVTNILGRQQGMTEETLKTILAMSQRTAKGNITRKSPELSELMEALEKWLDDAGKEPLATHVTASSEPLT